VLQEVLLEVQGIFHMFFEQALQDLGECQDTPNLNLPVMGGPENQPITNSTARCLQTYAGLGKQDARSHSAINQIDFIRQPRRIRARFSRLFSHSGGWCSCTKIVAVLMGLV
jgi:hypothetical protein